MRVEVWTHLCLYSLRNSPWKTKTDGARTFQHIIDILYPEGKHLFETIWTLHKNTETYTALNWCLGCADIRLVQWQVQLSDPHDTLQGVSHCQKRRPWKLQWLCTKTHEKPTAASCLNAVLHEAVKYRRAGLKSCRWWWGPGIRPLRQVSLSTYCSLFSLTHTLQFLLPQQHNVRFLQIMERWPLRHLVETSVASQYSPTL